MIQHQMNMWPIHWITPCVSSFIRFFSPWLHDRPPSVGTFDQRETLMSWPGITMFLLFFGIATMDALTSRNWFRIVFWIAMAIAFAALDYMGQRRRMSSR